MVEKIHVPPFREPYQKHARNISTFSTISDISAVGNFDPLKRDESAEIKCVFLCDSEHEKNCVFKEINRCLTDGQSGICNVQLMDFSCHWEQPRNDTGCVAGGTPATAAIDCRYCIPSRAGIGVGGNNGTANHLLGMCHRERYLIG